MFESFGNWNFDYGYIDEKTNEAQRQAWKEIALHFVPTGTQNDRKPRLARKMAQAQ